MLKSSLHKKKEFDEQLVPFKSKYNNNKEEIFSKINRLG
jgi:hypothetical protein